MNEHYQVLKRVQPSAVNTEQYLALRQRIDEVGRSLQRGSMQHMLNGVSREINSALLQLQNRIPVDLEVEEILSRHFQMAPFDRETVEKYKVLQVAKETATNRWAKVEWRLSPLDACRQGNYRDEVPSEALDFSDKLARILPTATWHVDHMVLTERPVQPKLDPFLVMEYKGQLYYLYVWNEPDFLAMIG